MAIIQVVGLLWLASTDSLTVGSAFLVMGLATAVPGVIWLIYDRQKFSFRLKAVFPTWRRNWSSGRWLFGASLIGVGTDASMYWLLAIVGGLPTTGIFAACMAMVQLANPLILGISNLLEPRAARAFVEGGRDKVRRLVRDGQLSLAIILTPLCVIVILVGADVVAYLYDGPEYANQEHTVIVLAFSILASALGLTPSFGLRVFEKSGWIFLSNALEAVIIVAVLLTLAGAYGVLGAAYAVLVGGIASSLLKELLFFHQKRMTVVPAVRT
jgi:O-antigen/teichoic acid export membrane protein